MENLTSRWHRDGKKPDSGESKGASPHKFQLIALYTYINTYIYILYIYIYVIINI